jgi:hypothetical protein
MNKETLEEAAERLYHIPFPNKFTNMNQEAYKQRGAFIKGGNWQAERSYSEEDMEKSFQAGKEYQEDIEMQISTCFDEIHKIDYKKHSFSNWIKEFKKK